MLCCWLTNQPSNPPPPVQKACVAPDPPHAPRSPLWLHRQTDLVGLGLECVFLSKKAWFCVCVCVSPPTTWSWPGASHMPGEGVLHSSVAGTPPSISPPYFVFGVGKIKDHLIALSMPHSRKLAIIKWLSVVSAGLLTWYGVVFGSLWFPLCLLFLCDLLWTAN